MSAGSSRPPATRAAPSATRDNIPPEIPHQGAAPAARGTPSWQTRLFRGATALWVLALVGYYGYVLFALAVLVVQGGLGMLTPSKVSQAFLFDQLIALGTHERALAVGLVLLALGISIAGEIGLWQLRPRPVAPAAAPALPPPPSASADPQVRQIYGWIVENPRLLDELVPLLGGALLPLLQQTVRGELLATDARHRWSFRFNLALTILSLLTGIPGVVGFIGLLQVSH